MRPVKSFWADGKESQCFIEALYDVLGTSMIYQLVFFFLYPYLTTVSVIQETWLVASAELLGDKMMDDNEEKENAD